MAIIRKDLIVGFGDSHLGIRKLNDFTLNSVLINWLQSVYEMGKNYNGRRILTLIGDIFDLKQTLYYFPEPKNATPASIIRAIAEEHSQIFDFLREFSEDEQDGRAWQIEYLIGNHDDFFAMSAYKQALRQLLPRINFKTKFITTYQANGKPVRLVMTHGHQFDPIENDGWGGALLEIIVNVLEILFKEVDNVNQSSLAEFLESALQKVYQRQTGAIAATAFNPLTAVAALLGNDVKNKTGLAIQIVHVYRQSIIKSKAKFVSEAKRLATGSRQYPEETVVAVLGHKHTAIHQIFDEKTLYVNSGCLVPEVVYDETNRSFTVKQHADAVIFASDRDPMDPKQTLISLV